MCDLEPGKPKRELGFERSRPRGLSKMLERVTGTPLLQSEAPEVDASRGESRVEIQGPQELPLRRLQLPLSRHHDSQQIASRRTVFDIHQLAKRELRGHQIPVGNHPGYSPEIAGSSFLGSGR